MAGPLSLMQVWTSHHAGAFISHGLPLSLRYPQRDDHILQEGSKGDDGGRTHRRTQLTGLQRGLVPGLHLYRAERTLPTSCVRKQQQSATYRATGGVQSPIIMAMSVKW